MLRGQYNFFLSWCEACHVNIFLYVFDILVFWFGFLAKLWGFFWGRDFYSILKT